MSDEVCNDRMRPGDGTSPVCDQPKGHAKDTPHQTGAITWPVRPPHPPAHLLEQAASKARGDRSEFAENRTAGLRARHETREARALIEQIAHTIDPDAFDETKKRSTHPAAAIQWEARKFMARESAEKVMRPIAEAVDLCWKATPYGSTEDGDTAAYILPKGTVHRLVGALQGIGVSAALRSTRGAEETPS